MKKAPLLLSLSALLIVSLACSLSNIADEVTGNAQPQRQPQPQQEQSSPRQEQPTAEYRSHNDPAANVTSPLEKWSFFDDFSDETSGWDRQSSDNLYTDYYEGSYQMAVYTSQYDIWANPGLYYAGDVRIEVEATLMGGEDDNNFGILCRYSGSRSNPSFYAFEISSDGYAIIGKSVDGALSPLSSDDSMMYSDAINQGYATNYLRADCIGNQLTFYVNGTKIISTSDSSLYDGDVGLKAGTFDAAYTEIHFDNFSASIP